MTSCLTVAIALCNEHLGNLNIAQTQQQVKLSCLVVNTKPQFNAADTQHMQTDRCMLLHFAASLQRSSGHVACSFAVY